MTLIPKTAYNVPNLLSLYRIFVVPVLLVFFYIGGQTATWINCFLFFLACISDLLDGIIARQTGQTSIFGKFIDSSSDKILIGGVLMLLVAFGRLGGLWLIPALIIFLREILVAGLREFLGQYNISVPISWAGKVKAAVQMVAMGFVMAGEYGNALIPHAQLIGYALFLAATALTILSGWDYLRAGLETLKKLEESEQPAS